MSRAKDIARAEAGNPHTNTGYARTIRLYVCANCHKHTGQFIRVGDYYFHPGCPKRVVPLPDTSQANQMTEHGGGLA